MRLTLIVYDPLGNSMRVVPVRDNSDGSAVLDTRLTERLDLQSAHAFLDRLYSAIQVDTDDACRLYCPVDSSLGD